MTAPEKNTPRLFISYAWTDPMHQRWVVDLATALRRDGVDVVLDVWDLMPGQDKFQFMERMVTDASIDHVLMICNQTYVAKANGREGGVGHETQIVTPELYEKTDSTKFIPVLAEQADSETPAVPAFLKGRIYVDLSTDQVYYEGYEELLRLLHGAPRYTKPAVGNPPEFISSPSERTATSPLLRRAAHAFEAGQRGAIHAAGAHLQAISLSFASLRVADGDLPMDELVYEAIRTGKEVRDEYLELLEILCRHADADAFEELVISFLETLLEKKEHQGTGSWRETEYDAVRFLTLEVFLSTLALLLARGRAEVVEAIMREPYVSERRGNRSARDYSAFYSTVDSIEEQRKQRLSLNRASLVADLLKERADHSGIPFEQLQLVDFLLYVRSQLKGGWWYPRTLVYLGHYAEPFDVFLALNSKRRFRSLQAMLDVETPEELQQSLQKTFGGDNPPQLNMGSWPVDVRRLLNLSTPD